MPLYEYRCDSCSHQFSAEQRMTEDPIHSCPDCGGAVQRLVSGGVGVMVKGGGGAAPAPQCGAGGPCCGMDQACGLANGL